MSLNEGQGGRVAKLHRSVKARDSVIVEQRRIEIVGWDLQDLILE